MSIADNNINKVVSDGLCVGCGSCVAVCPSKCIAMGESPAGLLEARADVKCNNCGLCVRVCPGWHLEKGLLEKDIDPFKGKVLAAYLAQSKGKELLAGAQSGGVVTALLCHLINSGVVDKAIVTQMPEDGSLRPKAVVTCESEEIHKARGSKYCQAAVNEKIDEKEKCSRLAVVGLGCQFEGLRNTEAAGVGWFPENMLKIGLFCDRVLSFEAMNYLIDKAGVPREQVLGFEFRSKKWRGWPGDVRICTNQGEHFLSREYRMRAKDTFTPGRCRLCFDKFNVFSDIAVGDAWGLRENRDGYSVVLVRSQRGKEAMLSARDCGSIELEEIDPGAIFKAQGVEKRREDWTCFTAVEEKGKRPVPDFDIDPERQFDFSKLNLSKYGYWLDWSRYFSSLNSSKQCLKAAKRHLLWLGWKNFVTSSIKKLLRFAKR